MKAILKFSKTKMFSFIAYAFGYVIPVLIFGSTIFISTQMLYYIVMLICLPISFELCRKLEIV